MFREPDSLYIYRQNSLVQTAVLHGIYENLYTSLGYSYQAQGLEKLPSLADGDAVINQVEVTAGDTVVDASGNVVTLEEGVVVRDIDGTEVSYDGSATISLPQMVVDFTFKPLVWEDGTPVTAADSVYSYEVLTEPDTNRTFDFIDRTASYVATGRLSVRWTGFPGWLDPQYFLNVYRPLPRHALSHIPPGAIWESEEANRRPLSNGPFRVQEWVPGSHITLVKNEHYYRAGEGYPRIEAVTFKVIPQSPLPQLLVGQCDIGTQDGLDVGQTPFLLEAGANGLLLPYFQSSMVYEHIDFGIDPYGDYANSRPDWFEDRRVRRAIAMCTDRQRMSDELYYSSAPVMHAYVPTNHPLYPAGAPQHPYFPSRANALLNEVGFLDTDGDGIREYASTAGVEGANPQWDGTPFSVTLDSADDWKSQKLAEIFRENMRACGIAVQPDYHNRDEWSVPGPNNPLWRRNFDLALSASFTHIRPPCRYYLSSQITGPIEEGFAGYAATNTTGWSNADFDRACQSAFATLPETSDYTGYHEGAILIFSSELPVLPLLLRPALAATRPEVCNFQPDPSQPSELWNLYEIGFCW